MAFLIPNVGKTKRLDAALTYKAPWKTALYTNAVTWGTATVLGDITEATFTGYAQTTPTFPAAAVVSNKGSSTAAVQNFTITAGTQTVVGYYLLDSDGNLVGGEAFSASVVLDIAGITTLALTVTQTETTE